MQWKLISYYRLITHHYRLIINQRRPVRVKHDALMHSDQYRGSKKQIK